MATWRPCTATYLCQLLLIAGALLRCGAAAQAQQQDLEFYVCPLVFLGDDGTTSVATHDSEFTGRTDGTIASLATALVQHARPDIPSTISNFFASPDSSDTPLLVGVMTTTEGHSLITSDGRCDEVPGSPLDTQIQTAAKLTRARAFLQRHTRLAPERVLLGMRKRNLVAAVYADAHERRGRTPNWPLRMCWPSGATTMCEQVNAQDVP